MVERFGKTPLPLTDAQSTHGVDTLMPHFSDYNAMLK